LLINDKEYCIKLFKHNLKLKSLQKNNTDCKKYIKKAESNLEFSNYLMDEHKHSIKEKLPNRNYYDWCITIYYYSIYHTALALIAKLGYTSNSHSATLTAVTLFYYHKNNILKKEYINFLINKINLNKNEINLVVHSKDLREKASYGVDEMFNKSMAEYLQKETADFVIRIKELLE